MRYAILLTILAAIALAIGTREWRTAGSAEAPAARSLPPLQEYEAQCARICDSARDSIVQIEAEYAPKFYDENGHDVAADSQAPGKYAVPPARKISSGFFVSDDGYIVTLISNIENAKKITVRPSVKDTAYEAHVAGTDPMTGIAVIKIDGNIFKPVKFGKSSALQQGHTVVAVGNPLGLRATISFGAVSGLNRTIKTESALYSGLFQYTAQVYPGDSGGLVLNSSGEAVGIIVATYRVAGEELQLQLNEAIKSLDELQALSDPKLTDQDFIAKYRKYLATAVAKQQDIIKKFRLAESGMSSYGPVGLTESLNFAIPADLVQKAIEQLKAPDHKVVRGVLGVKVSEIDDVVRGTLGLQKGEGLVIEEIIVDGPAAQAGLKTNDIIVSVDGKTVGSLLDMKVLMTGYKPGDKMKVVVVRGANRERKTIEATLGASQ